MLILIIKIENTRVANTQNNNGFINLQVYKFFIDQEFVIVKEKTNIKLLSLAQNIFRHIIL